MQALSSSGGNWDAKEGSALIPKASGPLAQMAPIPSALFREQVDALVLLGAEWDEWFSKNNNKLLGELCNHWPAYAVVGASVQLDFRVGNYNARAAFNYFFQGDEPLLTSLFRLFANIPSVRPLSLSQERAFQLAGEVVAKPTISKNRRCCC